MTKIMSVCVQDILNNSELFCIDVFSVIGDNKCKTEFEAEENRFSRVKTWKTWGILAG